MTGASTGIGRACAVAFDGAGYRVFAAVRTDVDATALRDRTSDRLTALLLDVTDRDQIRAAAARVHDELGSGRLAGLVNNAGIARGGPIEFLSIEDVRHQLEVNLIGQIAVTQTFLPLLRPARGRIIYIGSTAGKIGTPLMAPYNASKFALEALTDCLRQEVARWGIEVVIVEPGVVATPMLAKGAETLREQRESLPDQAIALYGDVLTKLEQRLEQMQRMGISPERVAMTVLRALEVRRPKTRYPVGLDARAGALLRWILPDRALDWLLARM